MKPNLEDKKKLFCYHKRKKNCYKTKKKNSKETYLMIYRSTNGIAQSNPPER